MIAVVIAQKSHDSSFAAAVRELFARPHEEELSCGVPGLRCRRISVTVPFRAGERRKERLARAVNARLEQIPHGRLGFAGEEGYYFRARALSADLAPASDLPLKLCCLEGIVEQIMRERELQGEKAVVVDNEGHPHTAYILRTLCKHFHNVAVITGNEAYFASLREQLMEEMGAALCCYHTLSNAQGSEMAVLAAGGDRALFQLTRLRGAVVLNMSEELAGTSYGMRNLLSHVRASLTPEMRAVLPEELPDSEAAALLCAEMGETAKQYFTLDGMA